MKFIIANNHIVIPVETDRGIKNVLLDTGAGTSVCLDNSISEIRIGENPFTFGMLSRLLAQKLDRRAINDLVGMEISAFLGPDFLEGRNALIDFENEEIYFNAPQPESGYSVEINTEFMGLPILNMSVNGTALRTAFDSGARYPFVKTDLENELALGEPYDEFDDYNPMFGHFVANVYKANINLGDCEFPNTPTATCAAYDNAANMVSVQAFLGIDCFISTGAKLWLSYPNQKMVIVK